MTKKNLYIFLAVLSLAGYAWLALNFGESSGQASPSTPCMFKEVTGLPCPSCGSTRALLLLARGRMYDSFMMNPFGLILAAGLVLIPLWLIGDICIRRDSFYRAYSAGERLLQKNRWLAFSTAAAVLVNWFWNISKGL